MQGNARRGFSVLDLFPLLAIPVLLYNLAAAASAPAPVGALEASLVTTLRGPAMTLPMLSGVGMVLTWGDLLLLLSIVLLLVEVIKSARTSSTAIVNHMLSLGVFIVALVEFLLLPSFASSTFFLLMMMALLDAMAGMAVTIMSARRDFDVGGMGGG